MLHLSFLFGSKSPLTRLEADAIPRRMSQMRRLRRVWRSYDSFQVHRDRTISVTTQGRGGNNLCEPDPARLFWTHGSGSKEWINDNVFGTIELEYCKYQPDLPNLVGQVREYLP
jgi:hypothetical protein